MWGIFGTAHPLSRAVRAGGPKGATPPPDFGRSVNPIQTSISTGRDIVPFSRDKKNSCPMSLCPWTRAGANIPGQTLLSQDVPGQNHLPKKQKTGKTRSKKGKGHSKTGNACSKTRKGHS